MRELSSRFFRKLERTPPASDVDEVGAVLQSFSVDRLQGLGRLAQKLARALAVLASSSRKKGASRQRLTEEERRMLSKAIFVLHVCGAYGTAYQGPDAALLRRVFPYLAGFAEEVNGELIDRCANSGRALVDFMRGKGVAVASVDELGDLGSW